MTWTLAKPPWRTIGANGSNWPGWKNEAKRQSVLPAIWFPDQRSRAETRLFSRWANSPGTKELTRCEATSAVPSCSGIMSGLGFCRFALLEMALGDSGGVGRNAQYEHNFSAYAPILTVKADMPGCLVRARLGHRASFCSITSSARRRSEIPRPNSRLPGDRRLHVGAAVAAGAATLREPAIPRPGGY